MPKSKRKPETLADGVADFYRKKKDLVTPFGAALNPQSLADLDFIARLHYSRESKRERDFAFADQSGFTLAQKIKTHRIAGIDPKCKAVIDRLLYDIAYIDDDDRFMYLYLDGGEPIAADAGGGDADEDGGDAD